jgi:AcrR family transcriptional regulator
MNNVQEESLREQKKLKRRALMLATARVIIATKGLRSLKVRDVAEAADCAIGSVYNEFGDFDGLILTVNRETVQALTVRLKAVPGLPRCIWSSPPRTRTCCGRCSSTGWKRTVRFRKTFCAW